MRFTSLKLETLRDLFLNELRDLYSAEKQLIRGLPQMVEAATTHELKEAFAHHLRETDGHVVRLGAHFRHAGRKGRRVRTCEAMKGLLEEAELFIEAVGSHEVIDAGLIAAAQRVEHYEMAGYGTTRAALAQRLGSHRGGRSFCRTTLDEENGAARKLGP